MSNSELLKSDQDGIESLGILSPPNLFVTSWNQTKMGLKAANSAVIKRKVRAKALKSDQDGIESILSKLEKLYPNPVEIRPRWDWKEHVSCVIDNVVSVLKSDQDGIESELANENYANR